MKGSCMNRRSATVFLAVEESHPHFQESGPDRYVVQLGADGGTFGMPDLPDGLIGATLIFDFEGCNPRLKRGDVIAITGDFLPAEQEGKTDRREDA
jgi:hypothetical protein